MTRVVLYKEQEPGLFHAWRNTGEEPFAKFTSPKKNKSGKWQITYRDPKLADPLGGQSCVSPKTMKDVLYELTFAINNCNDYQLGLSDELPKKGNERC